MLSIFSYFVLCLLFFQIAIDFYPLKEISHIFQTFNEFCLKMVQGNEVGARVECGSGNGLRWVML